MMKKFFTVFALTLALVISCASCVKTDIPTPSPKGEQVEHEDLLEFCNAVKESQTNYEVSLFDAWYVITLEEVDHKICANDEEFKIHNYTSIDFYRPISAQDLKYRASATTSAERLVNGESLASEITKGLIVGINGVAYVETYPLTLEEDVEPSRHKESADMIYSPLSKFTEISLESICHGFSDLTQVAYLDRGESVSTLTVVYEYETSDTKIEQTVIFEFDSITGAFISLNVHACKQTVTESVSGDDYRTQIVQLTCKTSIPLPVFEPNLESGNWA
ncbi:MAG: hypothetical protein IJY84_06865 [Clostridia bacterium]|nr:hypothetical protein [Clostridia bacterium]